MGIVSRELFVRNQTGHGGDQSSQTTQISANQKSCAVLGKAGQKQCSGDIADGLAGKDRAANFVFCQNRLEQVAEQGQLTQVAHEQEKAYKSNEKRVVYLFQNPAVGNQNKNQKLQPVTIQ